MFSLRPARAWAAPLALPQSRRAPESWRARLFNLLLGRRRRRSRLLVTCFERPDFLAANLPNRRLVTCSFSRCAKLVQSDRVDLI